MIFIQEMHSKSGRNINVKDRIGLLYNSSYKMSCVSLYKNYYKLPSVTSSHF